VSFSGGVRCVAVCCSVYLPEITAPMMPTHAKIEAIFALVVACVGVGHIVALCVLCYSVSGALCCSVACVGVVHIVAVRIFRYSVSGALCRISVRVRVVYIVVVHCVAVLHV